MEGTRNSRVNPLPLSLSVGSWVMCPAHRVTKRNKGVKYHKNRSKGSGDMERTRNSKVNPLTLTLRLGSWVMYSAHRLTEGKI